MRTSYAVATKENENMATKKNTKPATANKSAESAKPAVDEKPGGYVDENGNKLPRHLIEATILRKASARFGKKAVLFKRWKEQAMYELMTEACSSLSAVVSMLEDLGPDWVAPTARKGSANGKLDVGTRVDIREKYVEKFRGILEDEDLGDLEVTKVASGYVQVKTNSDGKDLVLPRTQVMLAQADSD